MQEGGRILGPRQPPFEIPACDQGEHNWNYNGDSPGPEVWRNPPPEYAEQGFQVDPWTCPIHELWNDVVRQVQEEDEREKNERIDGPEMLPAQKCGPCLNPQNLQSRTPKSLVPGPPKIHQMCTSTHAHTPKPPHQVRPRGEPNV